jgi:pilus assembly protein CpaC
MARKLFLGAAVAMAAFMSISASMAQTPRLPVSQPVVIAPQSAVQPSRVIALPLNKSQVLNVSEPVTKIAVGNADIVDAVALTDRSFYVLGKTPGTTNISVYGKDSRLLAVMDAVVSTDIEGVKAAFHAMMPDDRIEVRAINDSIAISGTLSSASKVAQAMEIAKRFTDKDKVINHLRVSGTQQVMLQVKVAEMQRTTSKALGFKPFLSVGKTDSANPTGFAISTLDPVNLGNFALAVGRVVSGNFAFSEALDALEEKGAVKILAEPNLVAMSGDTANFLAGGEFPIPTSVTNGGVTPTVSIEFKPFGISLAFTPTVVDGDLINLIVAPEVSQLDKTNSITENGFVIPGIQTRRAKTTVELRDGQSFAIAGLLSSNFTDTIRGIPGIMNIPVLGALARSSQYERNETELVIIITPKLVQPAAADTLVAPTDSFVPPSDAAIFLMGKTENPDSGLSPRGGTLTGKYGHIIR